MHARTRCSLEVPLNGVQIPGLWREPLPMHILQTDYGWLVAKSVDNDRRLGGGD